MIWPTGQRALHQCTLRLDDGVYKEAGLFPFFDATGRTRALMLVTASSPRIQLIDFEPGQFSRHPPWRKRLHLRQADSRDSTSVDAEPLAELWHFDPWWKLGAERYAGHSAVPILKSTNLPGFDESITKMWFASDLSRVLWVGTGSGEEFQMKKFRPRLLDLATRERGQTHLEARNGESEAGWRLRPWW